MKKNQLFNVTALFFIIIIAALIFSAVTHKVKGYKVANKDVLEELKNNNYIVNYIDFSALYKDSAGRFSIIDLRTPEAFAKGSLKKSVNIPYEKIFEKETYNTLEDLEGIKILTGDKQSETTLAFLFLRASGIDDIKVLPGSYELLNENIVKTTQPSYFYYNEEKARWDFPRQMGGEAAKSTGPAPSLPQQTVVKTPVKGGC